MDLRVLTRRLCWFHLAMVHHWLRGVRAIITPEVEDTIEVMVPTSEHGCWAVRHEDSR